MAIRGRVGEGVIPATSCAIGQRRRSRTGGQKPHAIIVIGKDTRISGYMFESALEAGLVAAVPMSECVGPMPTPGIAHLTKALRAEAAS